MTPAEALRRIRGYARAGRVEFSRHAYERMGERGATAADVIHACSNATRCKASDQPERWKATGPDLDGDDLTVVVVLDAGVLVITIF